MKELITIKKIQIYLICLIIFSILYLILYKYKGINKSIQGYATAINNCISYSICVVFAIIGYWLISRIIEQKTGYLGILIPIGWYMLCLFVVKRAVQKDFGIYLDEISVIKYIFIPYKCIIFIIEHLSFIGKYAGIILGALIFLFAYQCRDNVLQAIILIIIGIIVAISYGITFGKFFEIDDIMKEKDEEK